MKFNTSSWTRKQWLFCVVIFFIGIAAIFYLKQINARSADQAREYLPVAHVEGVEYEKDIRPVMAKRCLVCHGCYDAPCQLKLDSYQGILRGGTSKQVYDGKRLTEADPTRLFMDEQTNRGWRQQEFHPVLKEGKEIADATQISVLTGMLELKANHPLPSGKNLPDSFDLSLKRENTCPTNANFDDYAQSNPLGGMPYALPSLPEDEQSLLLNWIANGAQTEAPQALSTQINSHIDTWEAQLNQDDNKSRLIARYLYEHLYLAHIFFEDAGIETTYFSLVRSRTPPGQPIDRIDTRRPFDDPQLDRIYYRFWRDPTTIVAKTHLPYLLNDQRMQKWRSWFFDADFQVTQLPGYAPETASNPFITFEAIPSFLRHQFLLDEAQFTIMNFIKGAVCRGAISLSVIQDHFWVFFVSPDAFKSEDFGHFLAQQDQHLSMPAGSSSQLWSIKDWHHYAEAQQTYLSAKGNYLRDHQQVLEQNKLQLVWNGLSDDASAQPNPNAGLTVFRHYDSATVVKGLIGQAPKTAWIIDYPILERIHYLLVAGFDVFGSVSHQAMTRLYMDFLRMESEMNFAAFLPQSVREQEVKSWYQNAHKDVQAYLNAYFEHDALPPLFDYKTDSPKQELYGALRDHLGDALASNDFSLSSTNLNRHTQESLQSLEQIRGGVASILPENILIHVPDRGVLSIISNHSFTNISSMFDEKDRRQPEADSLSVVNGILGAYPNVILSVNEAKLPTLVKELHAIQTEADYVALLDQYSVRRTDQRFWVISDTIHAWYQQHAPLESGVLDYNRLENR